MKNWFFSKSNAFENAIKGNIITSEQAIVFDWGKFLCASFSLNLFIDVNKPSLAKTIFMEMYILFGFVTDGCC